MGGALGFGCVLCSVDRRRGGGGVGFFWLGVAFCRGIWRFWG